MTVKRLPNGEVGCGPIDFEARTPIAEELFIPTQLVTYPARAAFAVQLFNRSRFAFAVARLCHGARTCV
jgi:hypothetical protein